VSAPADGPGPWLDDRPTFQQTYAEHRAQLTRFTNRLAGRYGLPDPRRDAEDIVQATFEQALPRWPSLDNPVAWLYTVARNKVVKAASEAAQCSLVSIVILP
jgi:DNA-directed RNA polymerase specialized sigma24 family protein